MAWIGRQLDEARASLWEKYTKSWIQIRSNPELTRAKAQVLDDVLAEIRSRLNDTL